MSTQWQRLLVLGYECRADAEVGTGMHTANASNAGFLNSIQIILSGMHARPLLVLYRFCTIVGPR